MRLLLFILLSAYSFAAPSLVGQGWGGSDTGVSSIAVSTTSGTISSGGGTTLDIGSHDLIYVGVDISGGSTCYGGGVTVTISDTGTTNTFTSLGTITNAFWGNACNYHFWANSVTKAGDTITANFGNTSFSYGRVTVMVFRVSGATAWSNVGHSEVSGGNTNTATSASLGNGAAQDVIAALGGIDESHAGVFSAGACANSANCTIAATTADTRAAAEYQILTGTQTGATATITNATTGGLNIVAGLFRPTISAATVVPRHH